MLTIIAPNKNRLDPKNPATQFFIKSLQWQDRKDFNITIIDGGSNNYNELKEYIESFKEIPIKLFQYKIGEQWHKTRLNNIAIKSCESDYIATTDCDIIFDRKFTSVVIPLLKNNTMIESRTMYLKDEMVAKIYSGELDPYNNIDSCKLGRIKKRTTPGGFQCLHKDNWHKIQGYNEEEIIGWGSEDIELIKRVELAGIKIHWLGEDIRGKDLMLFHQPHPKNTAEEMKTQEKNKIVLNNVKHYVANKNGWGEF